MNLLWHTKRRRKKNETMNLIFIVIMICVYICWFVLTFFFIIHHSCTGNFFERYFIEKCRKYISLQNRYFCFGIYDFYRFNCRELDHFLFLFFLFLFYLIWEIRTFQKWLNIFVYIDKSKETITKNKLHI